MIVELVLRQKAKITLYSCGTDAKIGRQQLLTFGYVFNPSGAGGMTQRKLLLGIKAGVAHANKVPKWSSFIAYFLF